MKKKIYIIGPVTKRMQMRGKYTGEKDSHFVCGIDLYELADNEGCLVGSILGNFGDNFKDFVRTFIRLKVDKYSYDYDEYYFCDDPACDSDLNDIPSELLRKQNEKLVCEGFEKYGDNHMVCELAM